VDVDGDEHLLGPPYIPIVRSDTGGPVSRERALAFQSVAQLNI